MSKVATKRVTQPVTQANPSGLVGWGYVLERHTLGKRQILRHMEAGLFPAALAKSRNPDGTERANEQTRWRKDADDEWFWSQGAERDADLAKLALIPRRLTPTPSVNSARAISKRSPAIAQTQTHCASPGR